VLSVDDDDQAEAACRALLSAGISCVEITFRTTAATAAIKQVSALKGLLVGAGTVLSADQAEAAVRGPWMLALEIFDRVGGGDSFASGLIYELMGGFNVELALAYGVAHGALTMTTPGDTSMATLAEVERLVAGGSARIIRSLLKVWKPVRSQFCHLLVNAPLVPPSLPWPAYEQARAIHSELRISFIELTSNAAGL